MLTTALAIAAAMVWVVVLFLYLLSHCDHEWEFLRHEPYHFNDFRTIEKCKKCGATSDDRCFSIKRY